MVKDYESILRLYNPQIKWNECVSNKCKLHNFASYIGKLMVPSDYEAHESKTIQIYAQKFLRDKTSMPKIHFLMLAGGPGLNGRSTEKYVTYILENFRNFNIACYIFDHRGLNYSSRFVDGNLSWHQMVAQIDKIVQNGPFPIKDLTMHNGALDAGMLALAIQANSDFPPDGRLIVIGSSYGGALSHQTIKLLPNLFYSGILMLVPTLKGTSKSSMEGLAEHCALDPGCNSRIGGNIWAEIRNAIRDIANITTNKCTELFTGSMSDVFKETNYRGRVMLLSMLFRPLLLDNIQELEGHSTIHAAQFLIPFLKATRDCLEPNRYLAEILRPISKYFSQKILNQSLSKSDDQEKMYGGIGPSDVLANTIIIMDLDYYNGLPPVPDDVDDPTVDLSFIPMYSRRYRTLFPYLIDIKFTDSTPLRTQKTKIFVIQSRMDLNTTYHPAYELYESISAPMKYWLLMENHGHGSMPDKCFDDVLLEATGFVGSTDLSDCLKRLNEDEQLDWTFSSVPEMANLWNYVKKNPESVPIHAQVRNIPSFNQGSISTRPIPSMYPDRPPLGSIVDYNISRTFYFRTSLISLILCITISLLLYISGKKQRKRGSMAKNTGS